MDSEDFGLVAPVPGQTEVIETGKPQYGRLVLQQPFVYPDGAERVYFFFGNKRTPAVALAVTRDNQVIMTYQYRHAAMQFGYEVPGGCPKGDEDGEAVVRAELLEETGFEAGELVELPSLFQDPASWRVTMQLFLALNCRKIAEPKLDPTENLVTALIPLEEWLGMIMSGQVHDAKTISITMLALPYLGMQIVGS